MHVVLMCVSHKPLAIAFTPSTYANATNVSFLFNKLEALKHQTG